RLRRSQEPIFAISWQQASINLFATPSPHCRRFEGKSQMQSEKTTAILQAAEEGPGRTLSRSRLKPGIWYRLTPPAEEATAAGALVKLLVGVAIGVFAYLVGAHRLAILIWLVSAVIGLVTLSSQKARSKIGRFFAALGRVVGWTLGVILLTPI